MLNAELPKGRKEFFTKAGEFTTTTIYQLLRLNGGILAIKFTRMNSENKRIKTKK